MGTDVPFEYHSLPEWTYGRPFVVRSGGEVFEYTANTAWRTESDGRLRIGGTVDQEHERLSVDYTDRPIMMEGGVLSIKVAREFGPGDWTREPIPSE